MDIKTELHNLKTMVLTESHISDNAKEKIANKINQIEKGVVGQSEHLVFDENELDCPYEFTSRCTIGRCDCKPKKTQKFDDYMMKLGCDKMFTGEWMKDNEVINDDDLKICRDLFELNNY